MLHYFNPGHEVAVLNGSPYYHAPANVVQMQRDLAFLPAWYAKEDGFVLMENPLPEDFLNLWKSLSDFSVKGISETSFDDFSRLVGQEVALWGISPQSIHQLELLSEKYGLQLKIPAWNSLFATFIHRQKAAGYLFELCRSFSFVSSKLMPRFCYSLNEIDEILEVENASSFLAKAPYSSSGRGLLWLPKGKLSRTERQILSGYLKKQKTVSIEYVLQKTADFAMEFWCNGAGKCSFEGYSLFETNDKGNYCGNKIIPQEKIIDVLSEKIALEHLNLVKEKLRELFPAELASVYKGYVGVDMMIYRENNELKLHPCLEINLRTNMGVLAILLQRRYVHFEASGQFFVEYNPMSFEKHIQLTEQYPPKFVNGKMHTGYFPLCPVTRESRYLAYLLLD